VIIKAMSMMLGWIWVGNEKTPVPGRVPRGWSCERNMKKSG